MIPNIQDYRQIDCGLFVPKDLARMPVRMDLSALYAYRQHLRARGTCEPTILKYTRDLRRFLLWLGNRQLSALRVHAWAQEQMQFKKTATVNGALAALNGWFKWMGRQDCVVSYYKVQESQYREDERSLSEQEFLRLTDAADDRMKTMLIAFRATGIRVSELRFFTVEAVRISRVTVRNKGKTREVFLDAATRAVLLDYCKAQGVSSGVIFRNRQGRALSRVAIWQAMKRTAKDAGIPLGKVFPHNLRHLFAVESYKREPDIEALRLDMGHSAIATTQRYLKQTVSEHFARVQRRSENQKTA